MTATISNCYIAINSSLTAHQGFLAAEEEGDSLDAVEALLKKHDNFEKSLEAQEEKFKVNQPSPRELCPYHSVLTVVLSLLIHCSGY